MLIRVYYTSDGTVVSRAGGEWVLCPYYIPPGEYSVDWAPDSTIGGIALEWICGAMYLTEPWPWQETKAYPLWQIGSRMVFGKLCLGGLEKVFPQIKNWITYGRGEVRLMARWNNDTDDMA